MERSQPQILIAVREMHPVRRAEKNSDETEQLQQDPETTDAAMQLVSFSHQSVETE